MQLSFRRLAADLVLAGSGETLSAFLCYLTQVSGSFFIMLVWFSWFMNVYL